MSHPFYRNAKNTSGVPGRVNDTIWNRLKKFAHHVWEIQDVGDELVAARKQGETVEAVQDQQPAIDIGDVVLLFLGGRKLEARVLAKWDDGTYSLASNEGYIDNIAGDWMEKKAQQAPSMPTQAPQNKPSQRAITREDIPVQPTNDTTDQLQKLLTARGGHIAVELSPSTILELQMSGQNINARLWNISTTIAHQGNYKSIGHLVQSLGLNGWYPERPVESLKSH